MPYGEVTLVPGVNVERTPTLLQAGYSQTQFGRFKDGLFQKLGGWTLYYPFNIAGVPRDLHAWQDLNKTGHLSIGTTTGLSVITSGSNNTITPQTVTTNPAPDFTTIIHTTTVTITDPNISNVTVYDAVLFNTPVSVGGIILSGIYQIVSIVGTNSYTITASTAATSSVTDGGAVPVFTTTSGSALVSVLLTAHGLSQGSTAVFPASTTGNGVTIQGAYTVVTVTDANNFVITVPVQANANGSFSMNGGNVQFVYYINIGPAAAGSGYGVGPYGAGGYGTGASGGSTQTGTPITATDWTSDNWGQILLACPTNGGIYQYDPTGGFQNAGLVSSAPAFSTGMFVSTSLQILMCYGSTIQEGLGIEQDPLLINWSDLGNFFQFTPAVTNQAGNFRIPTGSRIVTGMAVQNQNLFWTDLDLWAANYIGFPLVFSFNKIGSGCGAIGLHSAQQFRGNVYWMGPSNFYVYNTNGVSVLPCPVWDAVFQNLNPNFSQNVRSMPNTPFNEVGWLYPSLASTSGECDSYVKMNVTEQGQPWDYGSLPRSAWIDQTILGPPIAATPSGTIYQHETSPDAAGQPLTPSFTTGYAYLGNGQDVAFIDEVRPDFIYGTFPSSMGAQIQVSINVVNDYTGQTQIAGPYTVNLQTPYFTPRIRGTRASWTITSSDVGSFWRLGKIRYRYESDGRR